MQANRCLARYGTFLNATAGRLRHELMQFSGSARGELLLQRLEAFFPPQSTAEGNSIRLLELIEFFAREKPASTAVKPACMKKTSAAQTSIHPMSMLPWRDSCSSFIPSCSLELLVRRRLVSMRVRCALVTSLRRLQTEP